MDWILLEYTDDKMSNAPKIKLTQVRSSIGRPKTQLGVLASLGLGRIGKSKEHLANPSIMGAAKKVAHLITIERI